LKKIFVIASRVPYPLDKGDKLRLYHQLVQLKEHFEITLCVLDDGTVTKKTKAHLKSICKEVVVFELPKGKIYFNLFRALFSEKPFQVHYFYQASIHRKIKKIIAKLNPDHIYCQLIRSAEYVKNEHHIPKTIDYMDAFSKGIERRIDSAGWKKKIFHSEYKRLMRYENLIFDYFEHHTIISEEDKKFILHEKKQDIVVVPNGVDVSFFNPKEMQDPKYDVLFVGNMSYAPNVDGVIYFVKQVLPLLLQEQPNLTFYIAGANPAPEVLQLASKNVIISGWVEDIREAYLSAKVFVAPMQIGTGLQNKLLEAMAMKLPCITSPLVNKSLKGAPEEEVLICNTPQEYATEILTLLKSNDIRTTLGEEGRSFVKSKYSWNKATKRLSDLF